MPDTTIICESEYGLAEAAILSEPWLSAASDVLAQPTVVTAAVEQPAPEVVIRKRGPDWVVDVLADRPLSWTILKSIEAVAQLLSLPPGWNSYSAKAIAPQNVARGIRLLAQLVEPQTPPPAIVPRVQGGIQLEWHTESIDIEVYIDSPEKVGFFAEHIESGESSEGPLAGREAELKAWVQRISGR